jgi:hypothetical protein
MNKELTPPKFCPQCGAHLRVVRHIMNSMFETACEQDGCEATNVISVNDHVVLPTR